MIQIQPSRLNGGVICAVVIGALLTITAVALLAIYAPPALAAILAVSSAKYIAIGCGVALIVAILAAAVLLKRPGACCLCCKGSSSKVLLHDDQYSSYLRNHNLGWLNVAPNKKSE